MFGPKLFRGFLAASAIFLKTLVPHGLRDFLAILFVSELLQRVF